MMATEHAPRGRRGFYSSFPQTGPAVGFLLSSGLFLLLTLTLSDEQFALWAWQIPFLLSIVLVAIGLYVRVSYGIRLKSARTSCRLGPPMVVGEVADGLGLI